MSKPLRTILLIGNSGFFILSFLAFASLFSDSRTQPTFYLVFIPLIILFILNVYFLAGPSSLYFKRKKLEEEIKIQEAENKLKELKKR
ncbi:hypothetical protein ES708_32482 [subsurface metagenome]